MPKLIAFENTTLDGYFAGANGDLSWAYGKVNDPEFDAFVADNAKSGGMLVLGRITYELMASYWPTPLAMQQNPAVAEGMNAEPKLVFSRTLKEATWSNTTLVKEDMAGEIRRLKQSGDKDMAILGSGSIVSQLAQEGLIDEFQLVVNPVVIGKGRTLFDGVKDKLNLELTKTRAFPKGNVLMCYAPVR
jgi:dihydrofolate reductase